MRIRKNIGDKNDQIDFLSVVGDALSHPVRIKILKYVKSKNSVDNDVCNGDLVNLFNYSQSTISQHVKKMINAELFVIKKRDKNSIYSVNQKTIDRYVELLQSI